MLIRPPSLALAFALALGCSASAPDGTVNTAPTGDAAAGGPLDSVCASICSGTGESCGESCVQRCQFANAIAPACADSYLALMRCAADNGYRCPSARMAAPPPSACAAQRDAWAPCFAAAVGRDGGTP